MQEQDEKIQADLLKLSAFIPKEFDWNSAERCNPDVVEIELDQKTKDDLKLLMQHTSPRVTPEEDLEIHKLMYHHHIKPTMPERTDGYYTYANGVTTFVPIDKTLIVIPDLSRPEPEKGNFKITEL